MKRPFSYLRPHSAEEAIAMKAEHGDRAWYWAGGTDLMLQWRGGDFPLRGEVIYGDSYDPVGPFGARGAGEAPVAAAGPAIAQAVYKAIGRWVDMPMTPENVVAALDRG